MWLAIAKKAWALREVYKDMHKGKTHGINMYVAGKVEKEGGGHPTGEAIRLFFVKVDQDSSWFPGKRYGGRQTQDALGNERGCDRAQRHGAQGG